MPFRSVRLKGLIFAFFLTAILAPRLANALDGNLAQDLNQHVGGMASVTEENFYDTYRPYLERSWELTRALYDAKAPAERMTLAEKTIAMLGKTSYPDTDTIQKFQFERFVALYQLGRGKEAEALLGEELHGQFLRNYLPDSMQDIVARASFREAENALSKGNLEGAPWLFASAAREYQKLEGDNAPRRIEAVSMGALSSAMNGRLSRAGQDLDQVFDTGNLSAESKRALAAVAGKVAVLSGRWDSAAAHFDMALSDADRRTRPHDGYAFGTRFAAVSAYLRTGQEGKADEIVGTLYSMTPSLDLLAHMHQMAGWIAQAANDAEGAKDAFRKALVSIADDPLQNFALRGALLSDYAAVGGGLALDDPFSMAGSGTDSILNRAERLIAERRYQAAIDILTPIQAATDLSLSQRGRGSLAIARAEFGLRGATVGNEEDLLGNISKHDDFPDAVKAGMLDLAFETVMRNRHFDKAGAILEQLETLVFAHRPEGHPDLYKLASLNAALYYKLYATNDFYDEIGQQVAEEFGKILVAASRDFGLTSPVMIDIVAPQVGYGMWAGSDWAENFGDGVVSVPHIDQLIGLLRIAEKEGSANRLAAAYERALAMLGSLVNNHDDSFQSGLEGGLAVVDRIVAAQDGRGPSRVADEARYLWSLFNGGAPRDTDIILAKHALDARGFDPRATMSILFGAPTEEVPHMANILKIVLETEYGIRRDGDSWGGFGESMMADMAFDPETGTHFGFAPFDAQSYPETESVFARSAAISDCFRNARPWADCNLIYSPLGGGELTPEESEECRAQGLQAEKHSAIYAQYEPQAQEAERQEKYELANSLRESRDSALQAAGVMDFFPTCWVYEKGPGVIDPEAGKVKPQINLSRVILKKKKKED